MLYHQDTREVKESIIEAINIRGKSLSDGQCKLKCVIYIQFEVLSMT